MTPLSESELGLALERALKVEAGEPGPAELAALRRGFLAVTSASRRTGWRLLRPVPVVVAAVLGVGTSSAFAAAAGVALPGPIRTAAVAIGLPVDDSAVARVRSELDDLNRSVRAGNQRDLARELTDVRSELGRLSPPDRAEVSGMAAGVLARAEGELASGSRPESDGSGGGGQEGNSATAPSGATNVQGDQDHRSESSSGDGEGGPQSPAPSGGAVTPTSSVSGTGSDGGGGTPGGSGDQVKGGGTGSTDTNGGSDGGTATTTTTEAGGSSTSGSSDGASGTVGAGATTDGGTSDGGSASGGASGSSGSGDGSISGGSGGGTSSG